MRVRHYARGSADAARIIQRRAIVRTFAERSVRYDRSPSNCLHTMGY